MTKPAQTQAELDHVAAARLSFPYWFHACVKIPIKDKSGEDGALSFVKFNTLQRRIEEALQQQQDDGAPMRTITGKVRQNGSSRYHMNRAYWMGRNRPIEVGVIADDKNTTPRMLTMWEVAHQQDRFGDVRWGNKASCAGFPRKFSHGTQLFEETANDPRAGQGGTLDVLISTETAHYKSKGESTGEAVFQSIANTVPDLPQTWIALESTANGKQGVYYTTYQGSVTLAEWRNGIRKNGFIRSFAAWWEADDYMDKVSAREASDILDSITEDEARLITRFGPKNITPERLAWRRRVMASVKISNDPLKMEQEYPSSEADMFISTGTQVFDQDGLDYLADIVNQRVPRFGVIEDNVFTVTDILSGWLRMWEEPKEGASYVLSADFMEGENADGTKDPDCHSVSVWRASYMELGGKMINAAKVAAIKPECRVNIDVVIKWLAAMAKHYGDCLVVPEVNSAFGIIALLFQAGVGNIVTREQAKEQRRVGEGKVIKKRGWLTTEASREQIVANAQRMIREQLVDNWCPRLLSELQNFIVKPNGRKEAAPGHHDDCCMEMFLGLHHLPAATRYTTTIPTVHRHPFDHGGTGHAWGVDPGMAIAG